jgi:hypothetical protein
MKTGNTKRKIVETAVGAAVGAVIGGPAGSVAGGLVGRQVATHTPRLAENKHEQADSVLRSAGKGLPNFCARGPGSLFVRLRVRRKNFPPRSENSSSD